MTNDVYVGETFDEYLKHHGILGMKWGVRRFQKYPAGYTGDGKYVGSNGEPRLPTKKEAKRDRQYNELKTKMKKWLVDAVESGDKRALKILKSVMDPKDYQTAYDTLVKKGVESATKTGDKKELKKFKEDLSKKEYRDAKAMAEFSQAVNDGDTHKMYSLIKKIDNENIKESALRVAAITDFRKKNLEAAKVESIMSAKLSKAATTAQNVANLAGSVKKVYDIVQDVRDKQVKRERDELEYAEKLEKKENDKKIEKIIKSGNIDEFNKHKNDFSNEQVEQFKKRVFLNNEKEINTGILTGNAKTKEKWAEYLGRAQVETINKATTKDKHQNESQSGAKGVKGETFDKTKTQNDFINESKNSESKKYAEKAVKLDKEIEQVFSSGKTTDMATINAQGAYFKLSRPEKYSASQIKEAQQIVKQFEASGSKVVSKKLNDNISKANDIVKGFQSKATISLEDMKEQLAYSKEEYDFVTKMPSYTFVRKK